MLYVQIGNRTYPIKFNITGGIIDSISIEWDQAILLIQMSCLFPLLIHIAYAAEQATNSIIIHGGGMASIGCPVGSSVDTGISFVAMKPSNGTILGNWTIDSTESMSSPING